MYNYFFSYPGHNAGKQQVQLSLSFMLMLFSIFLIFIITFNITIFVLTTRTENKRILNIKNTLLCYSWKLPIIGTYFIYFINSALCRIIFFGSINLLFTLLAVFMYIKDIASYNAALNQQTYMAFHDKFRIIGLYDHCGNAVGYKIYSIQGQFYTHKFTRDNKIYINQEKPFLCYNPNNYKILPHQAENKRLNAIAITDSSGRLLCYRAVPDPICTAPVVSFMGYKLKMDVGATQGGTRPGITLTRDNDVEQEYEMVMPYQDRSDFIIFALHAANLGAVLNLIFQETR